MRLTIVLIATLLSACQGYYERHIYGNERSPYFAVPVDSRFELTRPIQIPPGQWRIFFQNRALIPIEEVNRYLPYCELQVARAQRREQTIQPDVFVVSRVYQTRKFMLARIAARTSPGVIAFRDSDGGSDFSIVATVIELESGNQSQVENLLCAEWGLPQGQSFVTIEMIRQQLEGYFELDLRLESR